MKLGEIISSNTREIKVQSYELEKAPKLGSFVKTQVSDLTIYGVVTDISTRSLDSGRNITALGTQESSMDETYKNQPQLKKLLKTYFDVALVGYNDIPSLPYAPPGLHHGVYQCVEKEVNEFVDDFTYLKYLYPVSTDVLVANIRLVCRNQKDKMVLAGKFLTQLLRDDQKNLSEILKALEKNFS